MGNANSEDQSFPLYLKVVIALVVLLIAFIVVLDLLTFAQAL